jgi:hypothetical protein
MLIGIFLILFIGTVFAVSDISAQKTAPDKIKIGDVLSVSIIIKNDRNTPIDADVQEVVVGADPVVPPTFITPESRTDIIAAQPPYYEWKVLVDANSFKTITYEIKPTNPGKFLIAPTRVYVDGDLILSNPFQLDITCNQNSICEQNLGENYFTCIQDCKSGSADGVCDAIRDGICDPDCNISSDLDCSCGNGICESFENTNTCPKDCKLPSFSGTGTNPMPYIVGFIIIIILCLAICFLWYKNKKRKHLKK